MEKEKAGLQMLHTHIRTACTHTHNKQQKQIRRVIKIIAKVTLKQGTELGVYLRIQCSILYTLGAFEKYLH